VGWSGGRWRRNAVPDLGLRGPCPSLTVGGDDVDVSTVTRRHEFYEPALGSAEPGLLLMQREDGYRQWLWKLFGLLPWMCACVF
jgi:hypothetical protein